jgi:hypothetical protein
VCLKGFVPIIVSQWSQDYYFVQLWLDHVFLGFVAYRLRLGHHYSAVSRLDHVFLGFVAYRLRLGHHYSAVSRNVLAIFVGILSKFRFVI